MNDGRRARSLILRTMAALAVLGIAVFAMPARADMHADLRAGFYTDPDAVSFGGGFLTRIGGAEPWYFNPNVEFAFADERDVFSLNGDFHYDFPAGSTTTMWLGGGPAMLFTDRPFGDTDVDLGLNILAGFGAASGSARPYGQFKGVVGNGSRVALMGGVRF